MTKTKLNLFLLVDRTGSMSAIWRSTLNTINEFVSSLDKELELKINLAFFDRPSSGYTYQPMMVPTWNGGSMSVVNTVNTVNIEQQILQVRYVAADKWTPLSIEDHSIAPRGMTPLYDAICQYADMVKAQGLKKKDLVQFVIITDGDENCSLRHTLVDTKNTLAKFEKKGWSVVYLGANLESFHGGSKLVADHGKLAQYMPTKSYETAMALNASTVRYATSHNVADSAFTDMERMSIK